MTAIHRKQFLALQSAALTQLREDERTTIAKVVEAAMVSTTTVKSWFDGERAPDAHDVHLLAAGEPVVGFAVAALMLDRTSLVASHRREAAGPGTLGDGLVKAIEAVQGAAQFLKDYQHAIEDRIVTAQESVGLCAELDMLDQRMRDLRALVCRHTAVRAG